MTMTVRLRLSRIILHLCIGITSCGRDCGFVTMGSAPVSLLLLFLLIAHLDMMNQTKSENQQDVMQHHVQQVKVPKVPKGPKVPKVPKVPKLSTPGPTTGVTTAAPTTQAPEQDEFLGPPLCLGERLTRASCGLVFCPPWERCIEGECTCKPPYMCPTDNTTPVCGLNNFKYRSYCQAMAVSCRLKKPAMSHFGEACDDTPKFSSSVDPETGGVKIFIPDRKSPEGGKELLVCWDLWDMAAANVFCKENGTQLGAANISFSTTNGSCVSVRCQGYETSLAECVIFDKTTKESLQVATADCYTPPKVCDFRCVNSKCVSKAQTCDGVDDCGDRSDEMCCKKCRGDSFRCRTGVCVHKDALGDDLRDCLDGADESPKHSTLNTTDNKQPQSETRSSATASEYVSPKQETRLSREHLETKLHCGVPNRTIAENDNVHERGSRVKRVIGGSPAKPTQIQWQVALEEYKKIDCGGAYIGGCWVLTAAHCVRHNPAAFRVKFSLWKKSRAQDTTDIVPVEDILIHPKYNASSYENDIALVKLQNLPFTDKCLDDNPAVTAVCIPWTTHLFQPNHTCSISGWGRTADGKASQTLLWAKVSLISDCQRFYKDRFKPGMMCAGDLEGSVDSCQGDSGGPLVCEDELGVSYLWGIVSWGAKCGQADFPGVYTQVAHYFEWIRMHTRWPAVTKFNS